MRYKSNYNILFNFINRDRFFNCFLQAFKSQSGMVNVEKNDNGETKALRYQRCQR